MGWYVKRGEETVGPVDGTIVIQWVQQGMRDGAQVRDESAGGWMPLTQSPFAQFLMTPSPPVATRTSGEGLGYAILLLPLASTVLIWLWVGQMNLLQRTGSTLQLLGVGTVLATAVMMAVEANSLGMGKTGVEKGRVGTSPVVWFFCAILMWFLAFPIYLSKRKWYGRKSLAVGGTVVAIVFVASWWSMYSSIETATAHLRASLSNLEN
jgi:hypothetical protein